MKQKRSTTLMQIIGSAERGGDRRGFTLIELLIATSILVLLVVMVSQMVQGVASGTSASTHRIDADEEVRTIFDRMGEDIASMIQRPDANPLWLTNNSGNNNDSFYFLSQAPASYAGASSNNSQIALIGYTIGTNGLQRLSQGLGWDDSLLQFTNGAVSTNASSTNFVTIGPSVFRMEYALLMKPGTYISYSASSTNTYVIGTNIFLQTNFPGNGMKDVAGIVVALAILDQNSQKIIPANALTSATLINAYPDAIPTSITAGTTTNNGIGLNGVPMTSWVSAYSSVAGAIPQAAARAQIRVYQRYFPIGQ
jgi:prepilin-type N-terminal cleavage/methylation domain-containing protein